jgi:hypothetical protein
MPQVTPELGKQITAGQGMHENVTLEADTHGVVVHGTKDNRLGPVEVFIPWTQIECAVHKVEAQPEAKKRGRPASKVASTKPQAQA